MAPKRREGHAPAVGAVLLVVSRVELKHRAGVSRVRIINQGVVADHSCTSGMERELKSSRVSQISRRFPASAPATGDSASVTKRGYGEEEWGACKSAPKCRR